MMVLRNTYSQLWQQWLKPPLSPIWCLHNNVPYCTNSGFTKDTEINVFTVTLCLKLKP
jgi:hypothetical protein